MPRYCKKIFFIVVAIFIIVTCIAPRHSFSQDFHRVPIILKASEVIPVQWLKGPNYTIKERVTNDGVVSIYELDTTYGPLTVESTALLLKRMHELRALHRMEELQNASVFANAAKDTAKGTLFTAKDMVQDPGGTASSVGDGVGRLFNRATSGTSSGDPYKSGALNSVLGQASNKREFAYKFGIDPYSSYLPLQKTLDSIAWTATSGSLSVKAAFSVIPVGIGVVASLTSTADSLRSLVRDKTPYELLEINSRKLSAMGVPDSIAKIFLGNYSYNPSEHTLLVGELANMKTVRDRVMFIVAACYAQNEQMALFMRVIAQLMGFYNEKIEPIKGFIKADNLPLLEKKDGTVVAILPLDYLAWTYRFANMEKALSDAIRKIPGIKGKELLVMGTVEPRAKKVLEASGWKLQERFAEQAIREIMAKNLAE